MGNKIIKGINDLATLRPELAKQWHPTKNIGLVNGHGEDASTPDTVTIETNFDVWWLCDECGYEWQISVRRRRRHSECPCCSGRYVVTGKNDLKTLYPQLAEEWCYELNGTLVPEQVLPNYNHLVHWKCKNNHVWKNTVKARVQSGSQCPYCSGANGDSKYMLLSAFRPELAVEFDWEKNVGKDFYKLPANHNKTIHWKCAQYGHEFVSSPNSRFRGGGCPVCSHQQVLVGFNDLATTHPHLLESWDYEKNTILPTDIVVGHEQHVFWKCEHGHSWSSTPKNRRHYGCPYCAGQKVWPGFNDLATKFPEIAAQWHPTLNGDLKPTDVSYGSGTYIWWIITRENPLTHQPEDLIWKAKIDNRIKGRGCPYLKNSYGETAIRNLLKKLGIKFKCEYTFKDRKVPGGRALRDDFALFKDDVLVGTIEYNGEQHYKPVDFNGHGVDEAKLAFEKVQERDKVKSDYLKAHGIPQLIVPYWQFNEIETLVMQYLKELSLLSDS